MRCDVGDLTDVAMATTHRRPHIRRDHEAPGRRDPPGERPNGVPGRAGGLCDAYYLRDRSARPQYPASTLPVSAAATISILINETTDPRPATLRSLAMRLAKHRFFRL